MIRLSADDALGNVDPVQSALSSAVEMVPPVAVQTTPQPAPEKLAMDITKRQKQTAMPDEPGGGRASPGEGGGVSSRLVQPPRAPVLAIKDAVESPPPPAGMVRLYRGGGSNVGGPKWVTTDRRFAERYTTPGLARSDKAGSYLQYVDVPQNDPRVRMPPGQSVHSFEAPPDIADGLKPFYLHPGEVP